MSRAQPTKGSAILWPSLLSDDVEQLHPLTYHAALPVDEGHKFAANHWIHQYLCVQRACAQRGKHKGEGRNEL